MIPVAPVLTVRPMQRADLPAVITLMNRWLDRAVYSLPMDERAAQRQLVGDPPVLWHEVRWTDHLRLCAWRAGELVGFLDAGCGHDGDHLAESEYAPHGLVRFVALSDRAPLAEEAFHLLMAEAESYWQNHNIRQLSAFHISTGYPAFQAGAGVLPGDWSVLVRLFTAANWQLHTRYYTFSRNLGAPLEEEVPMADLSLSQQRLSEGRSYTAYHRRVELIAQARVMSMQLDRVGTAERVAHVVQLEVDEAWRNRNLGRWLLRRMINDATLQSQREMLVFIPMNQPIAMNLFVQHGFQENNYRGYSLQKQLDVD
jgi:ribosomal protein S18 acetylase RimI-like enzyme